MDGQIDGQVAHHRKDRSALRQRLLDGLRALVLEAAGHVTLPARYLSTRGQLLEGAPFSERDLRGPASPLA